MTESELCPPDPCVTDPIKKPDEFLYLLRKEYSIDVRGDRIPILSSLKISANINMTESELCPPDPCIMNSDSVFLFEIYDNPHMTESELCPPDPCVMNSDSVFFESFS